MEAVLGPFKETFAEKFAGADGDLGLGNVIT